MRDFQLLLSNRLVDRSGFFVSLVFFAYDNLLIQEASQEGVDALKWVLNTYEVLSGQKVSLAKSSVFFSKHVATDVRYQLASLLGIEESVGREGKYCLI